MRRALHRKDDTPDCTTQACGIRDAWGEFERTGAVVLSVSRDDEASHVKFKEKFEFPFALLADPDHAAADDYGVWVEKSMYGKTYMGVERSPFVVAADGTVAKVMRKVKPRYARRRRACSAGRSARPEMKNGALEGPVFICG